MLTAEHDKGDRAYVVEQLKRGGDTRYVYDIDGIVTRCQKITCGGDIAALSPYDFWSVVARHAVDVRQMFTSRGRDVELVRLAPGERPVW